MCWKRSETDTRRVIIVDFNHIAWYYAMSNIPPLTCTIFIDGVAKLVDSKVPSLSIKAIHKWADKGRNPVAVCFDSVGSTRSRKAYFAKHTGVDEKGEPMGYKAHREIQNEKFYEAINLSANFMLSGGVCCYKAPNYEADDLIMACVLKAKEMYPDLPIDIITGDQDMIPLVDEQVSVFYRSRKLTWAESPDIEKTHYFQIRPYNMKDFMESLTEFKGLEVPYNTVLLKKLLRGKKADKLDGKKDWKPKEYNYLIKLLQDNLEDIGNLFRYDAPVKKYYYRDSNTEIPSDLLSSTPKDNISIHFDEPLALTRMCEVLSKYVDQEDIDHIRYVYNGVNINGAFTDLTDTFNRKPAVITTPIKGYDMVALQSQVSVLKINLPMY